MAVYKKTQIAGIAAIVLMFLGGGVALLRPDLVPYEAFLRGMETVKGYVRGEKEGKGSGNGGGTVSGSSEAGREIYRIELKTGGRVYTDNLKTSDGKLIYQTPSGLEITLNSHEVMAVRKFKEGHEPD